jgi:cytoskeleton protein RodZ
MLGNEAQGRGPHADAEARISLGQALRAARTTQGLSIEEVAAELRFERRIIVALEDERFEELGPPVFAKGYLKHYGHLLGLAPNDLLADYYRLVEPKDLSIAPSRAIKLRDERQIAVWIVGALALALLALLLFLWLTGEPDFVAPPESLPSASDPVLDDLPPPISVDPVPAIPPAEQESDAPAAVDGDLAELAETETPTGDAASEADVPQPAAGDVAAGLRIVLEFDADSWVEVTDAGGRRLSYGLGRAGSTVDVRAEPPVDFVLGNVAGVRLSVDGSAYPVPRAGRQGNLARFTIDGAAAD